ncbi:MAG TPA: hypothetical protein VFQ91_06940 [Bryobacteraceae bacterium]|nr:hypothetical protein [Bryobacteraceae bacterium]
MSDFPFPQANPENVELAAANRRLTTAILGMTLLTGLVACLSYLAGRTVTHMRVQTATAVRTEVPPPPVVVEPLNKPSPIVLPTPPAPPAAAIPAPGLPPAGLYLQVGLINPSIDNTLQERLRKSGYPVQLAPMENSSASRLLVGPVQSETEQRELSAKLQASGYRHFRRQY